MTAPLRDVLVVRPGRAFGAAFDDPAHEFLHPVDLDVARREHDAFVELLASLGATIHPLEADDLGPSADSVYAFDPVLVTDRGAIALRPGKPNRRSEPAPLAGALLDRRVPQLGTIEAPGTIEGGDTLWLRPDLLCVGRSLRTNQAGIDQLTALLEPALEPAPGPGPPPDPAIDVRVFDLPYWRGPAELIHLLSVISPVSDDLAVVYLPLLPVGLWALLHDFGIRTIEVPDEELPTLGCNVLAVRPGVVVLAAGNPRTAAALALAGCEVREFEAGEIGVNGSGGPTCLTRPILRA